MARAVAVVAWIAFAATLLVEWTSTSSGVGLFGRPTSDVDIQRAGLEHPVTGVLAALLLGAAVVVVLFRRGPVAPALAVVGALAPTVRAVVGDRVDSSIGRVRLGAGLGLLAAVVAAWVVVAAVVAADRRR